MAERLIARGVPVRIGSRPPGRVKPGGGYRTLNHLAAWQEPDLVTTEIRAAFRSLR